MEIPRDELYSMKLRFLGANANPARREFQVPMNYKEKKTKEMCVSAFVRTCARE